MSECPNCGGTAQIYILCKKLIVRHYMRKRICQEHRLCGGVVVEEIR